MLRAFRPPPHQSEAGGGLASPEPGAAAGDVGETPGGVPLHTVVVCVL